ncbi:MAG: queuosine precursor transporter [Bacteroidales bacterium]
MLSIFDNNSREGKLNRLYLILALIFLTNALIGEFGGVKMFSAEKLFGIPPLHLHLPWGGAMDFNMSVGALIWPFVFILSDIMNEYFGRRGVRWISYMTAGLIAYAFILVYNWTKLPPADFWLEVNGVDNQGRTFDINYAYHTIFRQGMGIIVGSITAFLLSQFIDAHAFHYLRKLTGQKALWLRATGSTIISQLVDSFVILTIAFYLLGNWSFAQVMQVATVQYLYKVFFAIALTPVIYLVHYIIDGYLGKDHSVNVIEEADKNW